jgi:DNA-binding CsgD family transcriptional regulator
MQVNLSGGIVSTSNSDLTPRQREIVSRLEQGMGARAIANELGVSRNAIYQQIGKLRKAGVLEPDPNFREQTEPQAAPFSQTLEDFMRRGQARLDELAKLEEDHQSALRDLAHEREQIEHTLTTMKGAVAPQYQ